MRKLTFGIRSLAVLATSSAVAFTAPVTPLVAASMRDPRSPSHVERPAAAHTQQLRPASATGDGGAFFELGVPDPLGPPSADPAPDPAPDPPPGPAPGRMAPDESVATVRGRRCAGDVACFLVCTRAHESDTGDANGNGMFDAGYGAVSADGQYRGAYQFLRSTWDSTARGMGRDDLVGVDPAEASPADQDAVAAALYGSGGSAPWGGRC